MDEGTLPRINPAVDAYNAVSVRHALPAGAFDLDHLTGDVVIRHACSCDDEPVEHRTAVAGHLTERGQGLDAPAARQQLRRLDRIGTWKP